MARSIPLWRKKNGSLVDSSEKEEWDHEPWFPKPASNEVFAMRIAMSMEERFKLVATSYLN
eukprot:CAMPEP_0172362300 /NCGR_PEP_ID=MMETSP1060-20121228/5939_1 /TAXON_ID=37318 /ORGANISM="Pseudo-nitzschia pungens, Strain cf. cingulata" /LENGTH=60 /DNA_ID=CAMNT_0013084769 /DNA_START=649 /DNA_END=831 /DNA_ORIENTATION=+